MALYRVIKTVHFKLQNAKKNHFVVVHSHFALVTFLFELIDFTKMPLERG